MRWLLLDEVLEIKKGAYALTRAFFPKTNISSEILLTEMMAQTAGLLLGAELDYKKDFIFAKIENLSFVDRIQKEEPIVVRAESEHLNPDGAWVDVSAKSGSDIMIATGKVLLMNVGNFIEGQAEPISFHEQFMNHFKVREKIIC